MDNDQDDLLCMKKHKIEKLSLDMTSSRNKNDLMMGGCQG